MSAAPLMTLGQVHTLLLQHVPQAVRVGDGRTEIARVHSDTRSLQPGDLFVALRGERFDAHDLLPAARAAGAAAALAERGLVAAGLPGIEVPDALAALQALAAAWRQHYHGPLVAVAGSNGKTTVTQMTAAILRAWHRDAALATAGNLNNHIGVPLTLLRLRQDDAMWHRAAVLELGMNHPGEIAELAAMVKPTVALVNNAQREHQEFMHTVEAVARENGGVISALGASGVAVFPADDAYAPLWREMAGARAQSTFALDGRADVTADARWDDAAGHWAAVLHTPAGDAPLQLAVAGRHNLKNALAASAAALAAGAPLEAVVRGLQAFVPVAGRSQVAQLQRAGQPVTLVDDTYNANPDSMRAAIDVLAAAPGPRWLVMGDMGEVGDRGEAFHAEVGAHARDSGIDTLWSAGAASAAAAAAYGPGARHFARVEDLLEALDAASGCAAAPACRSVLVKGSRFMRMERVVRTLAAAWARPAGGAA